MIRLRSVGQFVRQQEEEEGTLLDLPSSKH